MTRFRALSFGNPIAPWRASRELAEQDLVAAGEGSRERSLVFLSIGATVESDEGEAPMTPEQERWAEALQVVKMFGDRAGVFIEGRVRELRAGRDHEGVARWRQIGRRVEDLQRPVAADKN